MTMQIMAVIRAHAAASLGRKTPPRAATAECEKTYASLRRDHHNNQL